MDDDTPDAAASDRVTTIPDESHGSGSTVPDASSSDELDDAGVRYPIDSQGADTFGRPPETCFAPCVWDVIAACRPQEHCLVDRTSDDQWTECEPETGWVEDYDASRYPQTEVFMGGRICYYFAYDEAGNWLYYDAAGDLAAFLDTSSDQLIAACPQEGTDELQEYPMRHWAPECADWTGVRCTPAEPGSCR